MAHKGLGLMFTLARSLGMNWDFGTIFILEIFPVIVFMSIIILYLYIFTSD